MQTTVLQGIEINPKVVGAIFTEIVGESLRVFCLYVNGDTLQCEVPVEENQLNINMLFAQLDMVDNCTSVIMDRVVQGRIYAQDDKTAWMYTLLATNGSRSPGVSSNIHLLPWKRIWKAQGTEVLLLKNYWSKDYCYAVRAELTAENLSKALAKCHPLVHPVLPLVKRTLPLATLSLLLLIIGLLGGGALWFQSQRESPLMVRASVPKESPPVLEITPHKKYYLLVNRELQGPFEMPAVLKLQQSGAVTLDTLIRLDGDLDWCRFEDLSKSKPAREPDHEP